MAAEDHARHAAWERLDDARAVEGGLDARGPELRDHRLIPEVPACVLIYYIDDTTSDYIISL